MRNLIANVCDLAHAALDEIVAHLYGAAPVPDLATSCAVGRRPHPATNGLLCRHHLEELGRWLREIEQETALLDARPSMSTRYDDAGGSTLASHRSPAVLDVIAYRDRRSTAHGHRHHGSVCNRCPGLVGRRCACPPLPWRRETHYAGCPQYAAHPSCFAILADRDEFESHSEDLLAVLNVLEGLADHVREARGLTREGPATVVSERRVLTYQLDWIARQDWVVDMRRDLGQLRRQLLRVNRNQEDEPLPGHCVWLVDGHECGGDLWPAEPAYSTGYEQDAHDGDDVPKLRAVECGTNRAHRWEGKTELARLTLIVERQQREEAERPPPPATSPRDRDRREQVYADLPGHVGGRLAPVLRQQEEEGA